MLVVAVVATLVVKSDSEETLNKETTEIEETVIIKNTSQMHSTALATENKTLTLVATTRIETTAVSTSAAAKETTVPVTAAKTEKATVTEKAAETDKSGFGDIAFLGNSRLVSVKDNKLAPNVYPVVGLDVRTVFTKHVTGSDVTVIDELDGKSFGSVVLLFGENECGWPNRDYFIAKYAEVIDAVKLKQPDAKIYLHAIIPISSEASAENECGCNNETICELNERIMQLAKDEGVNFIDVPECLLDEQGNLISEAASDGIHLNRKYSTVWMGYLEKILL